MRTGTLLNRWTAALVAILMMISLFAIPAFADETTAATTAVETTAATTAETTAATTAATTAGSTTTTGNTNNKLSITAIVFIVLGVVLVAVATVLIIKNREKVGKYLRVLKGECGKIVWLPWDQTKKNTWVVLVVLIICAIAICAIDFGLQKGYLAFIDLFQPKA